MMIMQMLRDQVTMNQADTQGDPAGHQWVVER